MNPSIETFADLELPKHLLTSLSAVGYETPTAIQKACIPHLLSGEDLLGEAQTGTGKTAAFALPILANIDLKNRKPQVLILAPTRELAIQVSEAFQKYANKMAGFHVLPIYGGQSIVLQLRALSRGPQVIVGTPGRVMDHLKRKSLNLSSLKTMVLDEADEMLRMGFLEDVEWILTHVPEKRQTALFSATMPDAIRRVANNYLNNPEHVKIRNSTTTVETITQKFWQVRGASKLEGLTRILEGEEEFVSALVFVRTKNSTVDLAEKLEARGYEAAALNGDMTQIARSHVVDKLKRGKLDIVVATDVAARGLDVPRISHVINFDLPYDTSTYVHRIGRTGRAGRTGTAIIFVAPREMRMLSSIERATRQKIEPISLPSASIVTNKRIKQFCTQVTEVVAKENLDFFENVIRELEIEGSLNTHQIAAALTFIVQKDKPLQLPKERNSFEDNSRDFDGSRGGRDRNSRGDRGSRGRRDEFNYSNDFSGEERGSRKRGHTAKVFVSNNSGSGLYRIEVGKDNGATPKEIVGAIANEAGIAGNLIGSIEIFADFCTVELPSNLPANIMNILKKARVRHKMLNISPIGNSSVAPRKPQSRAKTSTSTRAKKPKFTKR